MSPEQAAGYHAQEREDLVKFILANVGGRGRVLDIGCAEGRFGSRLKRDGFAEVWGVEPYAPAAASAAEVLDRVIVGTFPECLPQIEGRFDMVVMADSLEHIADPWAALDAVSGVLATGGVLVLSVPNVSHISVVSKVLRGRWDYAESGHLDRTHLRFFTPSSLRAMLESEGYEIEAFRPSSSPRRWFQMPAVWLLSLVAPHMLVFQMYAIAHPAGSGAARRVAA
jgi:2-polyprenyl-3-methyl-5-hydroxy-6-metoxy-1,4-benzoquinol methylase